MLRIFIPSPFGLIFAEKFWMSKSGWAGLKYIRDGAMARRDRITKARKEKKNTKKGEK